MVMHVRDETILEHYGFKENPYDSAALGVNRDDEALFVGRGSESKTFRNVVELLDHGGVVVEGGIGVGKTSFVNVQAFRLRAAGVLPSLHNIELRDVQPTEFLLSVLSNNLNSLRKHNPKVEKKEDFRRLLRAVDQTILAAWSASAEGSVLGIGGGGSLGKGLTATNPALALLPAASRHLDDFATLAQEHGFRRVVVSVNNLDNLPNEALVRLLNALRDTTLGRRGYVWVFLGPIGTRALIANKTERVSQLLYHEPILLEPLSRGEVREAIAARVRKYRLRPQVEAPIAGEVLDVLYEAGQGEFRYIMNQSTGLVVRTMQDFPTAKSIPLNLAAPMLRQMALAALERNNLTSKQLEVLKRLARRRSAQPKDYEEFGFKSGPAFLRYLQIFYALKLVDRREQGRNVVYVPRGDVVLALRPELLRPDVSSS